MSQVGARPAPPILAGSTHPREGRILVVDDEMLNRTLLSVNLQESGYTVELAEDGQQALEMMRARPFDAVLLDLIMPRMDGYQVLAEMKQDAALRRLPVIVISSSDEIDSIVRCIEMGATDYLTKPFNRCCSTLGCEPHWPACTRNGWLHCVTSLPR